MVAFHPELVFLMYLVTLCSSSIENICCGCQVVTAGIQNRRKRKPL